MRVRTQSLTVATHDKPLPTLLDAIEVAEILKTTPRHVRRLVEERRIPFLKVGRFVRFDPTELELWLASRRVAVTDRSKRAGW
jgi:excisionase family DNA binding protein